MPWRRWSRKQSRPEPSVSPRPHREASRSCGQSHAELKAEREELWGIARALGETGQGVIQLIADFWDFDQEFALVRGMAEASGRPLSLTIEQDDRHAEIWVRVLEEISRAQADGVNMRGQVPPRPTGVLQGLTATLNPFVLHEVWKPLRAASLEEKVRALRDPEFGRVCSLKATSANGIRRRT